MDRLYQAQESYRAVFGNEPPQPQGVADEDLAEALEQATAAGIPIGSAHDWRRDREVNPERSR